MFSLFPVVAFIEFVIPCHAEPGYIPYANSADPVQLASEVWLCLIRIVTKKLHT